MPLRFPQPKTRGRALRPHSKLPAGSLSLQGSSYTPVLGVLLALFLGAGLYLFSVNRNAVQGYHLRSLEKEIGQLEEKNAELRIAEADLRSFYRINESKEELNMQKAESLKYLDTKDETVALR